MWATLTDHLQVVYGAVAALAIVVLLTPAVGGVARRLGAVDEPDGRRLNVIPIPRLGGLALFLGIFVPGLAFLHLGHQTRGLLIGAAIATVVGAIIAGALSPEADVAALAARSTALCERRPLYSGFRGYTSYSA